MKISLYFLMKKVNLNSGINVNYSNGKASLFTAASSAACLAALGAALGAACSAEI
jgi:hypothetical protein